MIQIIDKENCCGCASCASICPKHCITMAADSEGFLYPNVNRETCIDCGLCEKVCIELHPFEKSEPLSVFAAINKNEEIRLKSSSGGIFYIVAEKIINEGGVVFGARFDENWQVIIDYTEDLKGIEAFMGSKYVQARVEYAYKDAKRFLLEGRKVLFSGTPCQIAGLNKFLQKKYDNLLTVDFICHGTPSPKVWNMYLNEVIEKIKYISSVEFRNKKKGWKNFSFNLRYNQEDRTYSVFSPFQRNPYMKAFLQDIILRPSCYNCKVKGCSSKSDITIADFWGIHSVFPEMDDDKGTGLVLINSEKGKYSLDWKQIDFTQTTYERIKPLNPACYRLPKIHPKREEFFRKLDHVNLLDLIDDCTKPTLTKRYRKILSICKCMIIRVIRGGKDELIQNDNNIIIDHYQLSNSLSNPNIISVSFRNKDNGWKRYCMEIKVK